MYSRVFPRDFFNESKLLKCLGQLSLVSHNGCDSRYNSVPPLVFELDPGDALEVDQDPNTGELFCRNLCVTLVGHELHLSTPYNSKEPYPLLCALAADNDQGYEGDQVEVFNNDGSVSSAFLQFMIDVVEGAVVQ